MAEPAGKGRFVWYDLMATDPKGATDFYSKVAGWGTEAWQGGETDQGEPYMMWMNGESAIGGLMELPDEARQQGSPPHWLAYVSCPDADATIGKARELGARILVEPKNIPEVGKFGVFMDPHGAVMAAFTPAREEPGSGGMPKVGEVSWNELLTTNHEEAFDFYSTLFGWEKTESMDMGDMGLYQMYGPEAGGQISYGGMYNKPAEMPAPPHWLFYLKVEDVNAAAERVKENGGQVLNGPEEVPGGDMVAQCMDPQGAVFALHASAHGTEG
jgi:predicted enzyme related to lactoylglutathione lyase